MARRPTNVVLHFKSVKIHPRININNALNNYRDRYDIALSFYIFSLDLFISTFGKNRTNYFFHIRSMNVQNVYRIIYTSSG